MANFGKQLVKGIKERLDLQSKSYPRLKIETGIENFKTNGMQKKLARQMMDKYYPKTTAHHSGQRYLETLALIRKGDMVGARTRLKKLRKEFDENPKNQYKQY